MPAQRLVSLEQMESLVAFLEKNRGLAKGQVEKAQDKADVTRLWDQLTVLLNREGMGCDKTTSQWRAYWRDLKYRVKRKVEENEVEIQRTGVGPPLWRDKQFQLEERIRELLGYQTVVGNDSYRIPYDFDEEAPCVPSPSRHPPAQEMPPARQTSGQQLEHMIGSFEKNFIEFFPSQPFMMHVKNKAWSILTHQLNSMGPIKKNAESWRKYWNLMKHRTKAKIMEYQTFKRAPKGFKKKPPPLHSLQKRIWRILLKMKDKEINITNPETTENEREDDSLFLTEVPENANNCSDAEQDDSQHQNSFEYYNLDDGDTHLMDHSQSIQETETEEIPLNESSYETTRVKFELEEVVEEENEEEVGAQQMYYLKTKPHRTSKAEKPSDHEDDNENSDPDNEIAKLQKELLKKQILVAEHKLFQVKLQNELLKKQLQEETEKNTHNRMIRKLEKEELQRKHLDKIL